MHNPLRRDSPLSHTSSGVAGFIALATTLLVFDGVSIGPVAIHGLDMDHWTTLMEFVLPSFLLSKGFAPTGKEAKPADVSS